MPIVSWRVLERWLKWPIGVEIETANLKAYPVFIIAVPWPLHEFLWYFTPLHHNSDVIKSLMACQITSIMIVYWTVYSGPDLRKHQSSASLAFVRGIHRWPVNSPHKRPLIRKIFHLMTSSFYTCYQLEVHDAAMIYECSCHIFFHERSKLQLWDDSNCLQTDSRKYSM